MDDGAGRRHDKHVEIKALGCLNFVPVCHEKGSRGCKGTLSNVQGRIVVELLRIGRPGREKYSQNQRPDRTEGGHWWQHSGGEGQASGLSGGVGGSNDTIMKIARGNNQQGARQRMR
jgi:hypothetical protein